MPPVEVKGSIPQIPLLLHTTYIQVCCNRLSWCPPATEGFHFVLCEAAHVFGRSLFGRPRHGPNIRAEIFAHTMKNILPAARDFEVVLQPATTDV